MRFTSANFSSCPLIYKYPPPFCLSFLNIIWNYAWTSRKAGLRAVLYNTAVKDIWHCSEPRHYALLLYIRQSAIFKVIFWDITRTAMEEHSTVRSLSGGEVIIAMNRQVTFVFVTLGIETWEYPQARDNEDLEERTKWSSGKVDRAIPLLDLIIIRLLYINVHSLKVLGFSKHLLKTKCFTLA
jgi:hypothetical protein